MKKRIITWMVSIAMVVSTFAPAIPGYAQTEGQPDSDTQIESELTGVPSDAEVGEEPASDADEGKNEAIESETDTEVSDDRDELSETDTDEDVETSSSDEGEISEPQDDELTEQADSTVSENAYKPEDIIEDTKEDAELLGGSATGEIGIYIDDDDDMEYISFRPEAEYSSAYMRIQKVKDSAGADIKDAPINEFGVRTGLSDSYPELTGTVDENYAALAAYYKHNRVLADLDDLAPGTYKLWAVFGTADNIEHMSNNLIVNVGEIPENLTYEITPATAADKNDGIVVFTGVSDAYDRVSLQGLEGPDIYTYAVTGEHKAECDELYADKYTYYLYHKPASTADKYLADEYTRTICTKVTVPVQVPVKEMKLYMKAEPSMDPTTVTGLSFPVGQEVELGCTVSPANAYDTGYVWESSNPKVLSIDQQGNLKALKVGQATIKATSAGLDASGNPLTKEFNASVFQGNYKKLKTFKFDKKFTAVEMVSDTYSVEIPVSFDKEFDGDIDWKVSDGNTATWNDTGKAKITTSAVAGAGKATATLKFTRPGKVTVTVTASKFGAFAETYETKLITTTVTVDGLVVNSGGKAERYIKDGRSLTGLMGFAPAGGESFKLAVTGNAVLKSKELLYIVYADPATGEFVENTIVTIGKKRYYFNEDRVLVKGESDKQIIEIDEENHIYMCVNKSGEIVTGWVTSGDKEYYFDPVTGYRVKSQWVGRGKGYTWVNADGLMMDDGREAKGSFEALPPASLLDDGIHTIGGNLYCFKGGIKQGGFIFFDSMDKPVKASNAKVVRYFDDATGVLNTASTFTVKGKTYYNYRPDEDSYIYAEDDAFIPLKTLYQGADYNLHFTDKNGVPLKNQFVTSDGYEYYANENGCMVMGCNMVIKGKTYLFDSYGRRKVQTDEYELSPYQTKTEGGTYLKVYTKYAKAGKPANGVVFYYKDGEEYKLVNNMWLYDDADVPLKIYHTDKNGKLLTGVYREEYRKAYWLNPKTGRIGDTTKGIVTWKGKKYVCDIYDGEAGRIILGTNMRANDCGFIQDPSTSALGAKYVFIKNESGELGKGIFNYNGSKFLIGDDYYLPAGGPEPYKGKLYFIDSSTVCEGRHIHTLDTKGPAFVDYDGTTYAVGKDGTIKGGWITLNGKKYYTYNGVVLGAGMCFTLKGKLYLVNGEKDKETGKYDPYILTGWQVVDAEAGGLTVMDVDSFTAKHYPEGTYYFCFDAKTGAALAGYKKINAPKTYSNGKMQIGSGGLPVIGNVKKNVYFNDDASSTQYPIGALIRDSKVMIGGKLYKIGDNGVAVTDDAAFTTLEYDSERYDAFLKKDGTFATGRTSVKLADGNTVYYYFDGKGRMEKNVIRKTGSKWYYYGANGQMAFDPEVYDMTGYSGGGPDGLEPVNVIFNKDGSIKKFVKYNNGIQQTAADIRIGVSYSGYLMNILILNKKGMPVTGLHDYESVSDDIRLKAFINPDGSVDNSTDYKIVKSGSKYYVVYSGMVMTDTTTYYDIDDYSSLSASDRAALDRCDELSGGKIYVFVNSDGSLSSGAAYYGGKPVHKNKYGMPIELYSAFAKSGKNWYVSYSSALGAVPGKPGSITLQATDTSDYSKGKFEVTVAWDSEGRIKPIIESSTGKVLGGVYRLDKVSHNLISIKKGLPAGGKRTFKYGGVMNFTVDFDKDSGMSTVSMK